jgi:hypothetical protein
MTVKEGEPKSMAWPVAYAPPGVASSAGDAFPDPPPGLQSRLEEYEGGGDGDGGTVRVAQIPERVVAVGTFSDASVEPVVRRAERELRSSCARDGLEIADDSSPQPATKVPAVQFAQYDAVYTAGKRRGEVWIDLKEGSHPWSLPSQ